MLIPRRTVRTSQPQFIAKPKSGYGDGAVIVAAPSLSNAVNGSPLILPSTLTYAIDSVLGRVITNSAQTSNAVSLPKGIVSANWTAVFVGRFQNEVGPGYNSHFKSASGGFNLKFMHVGSGSAVFSMVVPGVAVYLTSAPVVSGAPYAVAFLGTNGGTLQVISRRLDTGEIHVSAPIAFGTPTTNAGSSYLLSEETAGYGSGAGSKLAMAAIINRRMSQTEALAILQNPWQIFEDEEDYVFVPAAGGGSTLNASASGGSVASGSANLAAQIALAGVGVSVAGGSANAGASVPLSAAGIATATGSATPAATITINASGLAQAAGSAGLSASVLLAGAGAAQAAGNATLAAQLNALAAGAAQAGGSANLSGGAPGELNASGQAQASGSAVLSVTIGLQASGAAQAGGSASGSASAPGQVSASGGAAAGGAATWSVTASITAAGFVQSMGAGQLTISVNLVAMGAAVASGAANLGQPGAGLESDSKFIIRAAARNRLIKAAPRNNTINRRAA